MPLNEQEKAALSKTRGRLAAGIKDPEQRRKFIAEQGEVDRRGGKRHRLRRIDAKDSRRGNKTGFRPSLRFL